MKRMDLLPSFYDFLADLIFRSQIKKATTEFFDCISEGDKVLIIGGGTGWILEQLKQRQLKVTYIDILEGMVRKARKRKFSFPVEFISGSYTYAPNEKFDVIITPFFLDMFSNGKIGHVVQHISTLLKKDGIWLFSDFIPSNKIHHRVLIKIMYLFFSLFYKIEEWRLPDYDKCFSKNGYKVLKRKDSYSGLITSRIYSMKN